MALITNFEALIKELKTLNKKTTVAVVNGVDSHSRESITSAIEQQLIDVIMIGSKSLVEDYPIFSKYPEAVKFIDVDEVDEAARVAVQLIHKGQADVLMKGLINTDNLLRVVLDKESGLLPQGNTLSHLAIADIPNRDKLLFFSDAAVIPSPTLDHKKVIIRYILAVCRSFGIAQPKVGLVHFTEKVNEKFPNSTDAVALKSLAKEGFFGDVIMDGPIDLSTACDSACANLKGIDSKLKGDADVLLLPNIESGNVFYKSLALFAKADMAGVLLGTSCPVITTSRSDSSKTKFNSIAMACLMVQVR